MRLPGRIAAATVSVVLLALSITLPVGVGYAQEQCTKPGSRIVPVPWAQRMLDPDRVWPFTDGSGVTVAVLDSGVDAQAPQLRGQVVAGRDFLHKGGDGRSDCVGHGTGVAGIIAAKKVSSVGFHGLAPGVRILPVTVSETNGDSPKDSDKSVSPEDFGKAIDWAVDHGAQVINISLAMYHDFPAVRDAIARAIAHDVVVVAAAGNRGAAEDGNPRPYPAAYPGVIGVGAIAQDGTHWEDSQHGDYVDLTAPGAGVVTLQRRHGMQTVDGTSFATPYVSATAALILARYGKLSVAQVTRRLEATAMPAPGTVDTGYYGYGIVDPYQAVTGQMATGTPEPLPAMATRHRSKAEIAWERAWSRHASLAYLLVGLALVTAIVIIAVAALRSRARRYRWRPVLAASQPPAREDEFPAPPAKLFDE